MFPYITVLNRQIGLYGVCALVGFFLATAFVARQTRRYGITVDDIILAAVFSGIFALLGAHVFFGITQVPQLISVFSGIGSLPVKDVLPRIVRCFSGMVFYGGFLGAAFGLRIYTGFWLKSKRSIMTDLFAISVPLFHFFGRIGCFLGGCCYGRESDIGFLMPNTPRGELGEVVRRFPIQLAEAGFNLLLFFFLFSLYRCHKCNGKMLSLYLLFYPSARFVLEFFRGDEVRGILWGLSTSQWTSLFLILVSIFSLLKTARVKPNKLFS